jgi:hypothetical protein
MRKSRNLPMAALLLALLTSPAAAQSAGSSPQRDSLWNGTLIGIGAGIGSAAALDAVFCENGFGGCDFPWAAYLTLGAIGGAAGAGVDFVIGRNSGGRTTTLRLLPIVGPARKGVLATLALPQRRSVAAPVKTPPDPFFTRP